MALEAVASKMTAMDRELADTPCVVASRFGLLMAQTRCHFCHAITPTAALWVAAFQELEEAGSAIQGEAAVLQFIEALEPAVLEQLQAHAPWLWVAFTRTSDTTYLAHHCTTCGALQGDHFIFSPDGPYWPKDDADLALLRFIEGVGPLNARGCTAESAWMERVERVCARG